MSKDLGLSSLLLVLLSLVPLVDSFFGLPLPTNCRGAFAHHDHVGWHATSLSAGEEVLGDAPATLLSEVGREARERPGA